MWFKFVAFDGHRQDRHESDDSADTWLEDTLNTAELVVVFTLHTNKVG